ncbi:hypothetical protein L1D14_10715 [Vibrio tubiashii]|uniref:hypothetical protein n=1 Tax=Vibrio tubiashii TaxID=29498 RepID=UPI001EFD3D00|nr:hypothetical protein [Vibrio tubiashii]MCG9576710.1 hypothetical protein [Vibrio tubiashii]
MKIATSMLMLATLMSSVSTPSLAGSNMAYREHLLNARAHLEQAKKALERADLAKDGSLRHTFSSRAGKEQIQIVINGIDFYFDTPLQPQISPEQFDTKSQGE